MLGSARMVRARMGAIAAGMRTGVILSHITFRSNALVVSTITRALRLCAFRGRSRHTSGFEPYETFELPTQELISSATRPIPSEESMIHLRPTRGSDVFQWIDSSMEDAELAQAAARYALRVCTRSVMAVRTATRGLLLCLSGISAGLAITGCVNSIATSWRTPLSLCRVLHSFSM